METPAPLRLRKREDRRLRAGHVWIYSNEVDTARTPLTSLAPGSVVRVEDASGQFLGLAHASPHSLLCARLLTRDPRETVDADFYGRRIAAALALRQPLLDTPFCRLVHGEGDGLPGLVVDRHGDSLVLQAGSQGMERDLPLVTRALAGLLAPEGILLRGQGAARRLEQLPERVEVLAGTVPERLWIEENGCRFAVDPWNGQKTGWFYDHRANRRMLQKYAAGRRVLDLFSYTGAFSLPLADAGASGVLAVDSSAPALQLLEENARANRLSGIATLQGDVLETLRRLRDQGESFDLVVLDPPALIKSRRDLREGSQAYQRLNDLALRLLRPGGLLFSASCSFHLGREMLLDGIAHAARRTPCQILGEGGQDTDHPVLPAVPESRYLKAFLAFRPHATAQEDDAPPSTLS